VYTCDNEKRHQQPELYADGKADVDSQAYAVLKDHAITHKGKKLRCHDE
jgi:hypothetical protein